MGIMGVMGIIRGWWLGGLGWSWIRGRGDSSFSLFEIWGFGWLVFVLGRGGKGIGWVWVGCCLGRKLPFFCCCRCSIMFGVDTMSGEESRGGRKGCVVEVVCQSFPFFLMHFLFFFICFVCLLSLASHHHILRLAGRYGRNRAHYSE